MPAYEYSNAELLTVLRETLIGMRDDRKIKEFDLDTCLILSNVSFQWPDDRRRASVALQRLAKEGLIRYSQRRRVWKFN